MDWVSEERKHRQCGTHNQSIGMANVYLCSISFVMQPVQIGLLACYGVANQPLHCPVVAYHYWAEIHLVHALHVAHC